MGLSDWLSAGQAISEPIKAVGELYTTDKARIGAETEMQKTLMPATLAQINNNALMTTAKSLFVSGWQPLTGWTAGFLILLYYAPQIIITTIIWAQGCFDTGIVEPFPMSPEDLMNLVYLLFGFGAHSLLKGK